MIAHELTQVVLESSLRGGVALALAGVMALALRRRSGAVRHAVWLAGLAALLVAPLAGALLPRLALPILPATSEVATASPRVAARSLVVESAHAPVDHSGSIRSRGARLDLWTWIWMAGALWMLARAARGHARVASLARASEPVRDARIAAAWGEAIASGAVPPLATCRTSPEIEVPIACGLARPLVLLPASASAWSEATLHAVLAHELAHLRRRDPLLLAVAQVARALYWFHPLVWIALRELRAESERACDDAVLRAGERPSRYAETLLAFAGGAAPEPAAALAFLRPRGLERRIAGILAAHHDRRALGPLQRACIAVSALAAVAILSTVQPVPGAASRSATRATPRPEGVSDGYFPERWWGRARAVEPRAAKFRNTLDSPVRIRYAEVRIVPRVAAAQVGITMPELTLENRDASRRITAVKLAFDLPTTRDRLWIEVPIPPAATTRLRMDPPQWSAVVAAGDEDRLMVRVTGVRFGDGEGPSPGQEPDPVAAPRAEAAPRVGGERPQPGVPWSGTPRAAPPGVSLPSDAFGAPPGTPKPGAAPQALPPGADGRRVRIEEIPSRGDGTGTRAAPRPEPRPEPRPDDRGWIMARFRNPDDAPVVIVDARTAPRETSGGGSVTGLPEIVIENRSERRVTGLRIRYKAALESHAVSGYDVTIRPHGSVFLHREDFEMDGRPEDMTVQILGARFADGSVWGTLDSRIDARDRWVYPLSREER